MCRCNKVLFTRWRMRTFASAWTDGAEHSTMYSSNDCGDPSNMKISTSNPTTRLHNSTGGSQITSVSIMSNDPTRGSTTTYPMTSISTGRCLSRKKTQSTLNSLQIGLDNGVHFIYLGGIWWASRYVHRVNCLSTYVSNR